MERATHRLLHPCNEVITVLLLLQARERHLRARNVFFGVLEVLEQGLLIPGDALADVRSGVREPIGLAGLAAEDTARGMSDVK